jgi:NTP pyrophosphatase (non-canonical NTP hydrolase)
MEISDIQKWERGFSLRKGIAQDEDKALKIATLKLSEEVGEVYKDILEDKWEDVPAEVADVIVFACKIANIAEDFHNTQNLTTVIEKKIDFCEKRTYDKDKNKMNKPENEEFK